MGKMADLYEQETLNRARALEELTQMAQQDDMYVTVTGEELQYKKLSPTAKLPSKAHNHDAAYDLYADASGENLHILIEPGQTKIIPTGMAICPPRGWSCDIRGRSGMNSKGKLAILGLVDADYTGPWGIVVYNSTKEPITIQHHDKIAQFTVNKVYASTLVEVEEFKLDGDSRGTGGFGSTGTK